MNLTLNTHRLDRFFFFLATIAPSLTPQLHPPWNVCYAAAYRLCWVFFFILCPDMEDWTCHKHTAYGICDEEPKISMDICILSTAECHMHKQGYCAVAGAYTHAHSQLFCVEVQAPVLSIDCWSNPFSVSSAFFPLFWPLFPPPPPPLSRWYVGWKLWKPYVHDQLNW